MSDIVNAIKQICDEKGLSYEAVIETVESALAAAYRKDFGEKNQNIRVEFNPETGKSKVFDVKTVVEDLPEEPSFAEATEGKEAIDTLKDTNPPAGGTPKEETADNKKSKGDKKKEEDLSSEALAEEEVRKFNPKTEIQITDAKLIKKTAKLNEEIKIKLGMPEAFGRMAAQTAKQVIIQKLREAERDMIFHEFKDKEKEVVSGVVQRRENRVILVDLGKAVGVLPPEEQIMSEQYVPGDRIKVYVKEVRTTSKGPEIILSRIVEEILRKIFYLEIPEISNGLIEIKSIAREAGNRSKVAVMAVNDNVDPVGSCVGQRGARIQTIINELGGEKVDIIEYNEDPAKFIANSLSPAKVLNVKIDEKKREAKGMVSSDQLSLAIGRGGQNVRLAARLTRWKIDIVEDRSEKEVKTVKEEGEGREDKEKGVEQEGAKAQKRKSKDEKDESGKKGERKDKEQESTKTSSSTKATADRQKLKNKKEKNKGKKEEKKEESKKKKDDKEKEGKERNAK